jgi:UDP-glucose 4-epimerase
VNVLMVGGTGYTGESTTDLLKATGFNVRVRDFLVHEESYQKPVDFTCGDIRERDCFKFVAASRHLTAQRCY